MIATMKSDMTLMLGATQTTADAVVFLFQPLAIGPGERILELERPAEKNIFKTL